jgi:hypothetical protein
MPPPYTSNPGHHSPAELKARLGQLIVTQVGAGVALSQVGRMGGNLVGNQPRLYIVTVLMEAAATKTASPSGMVQRQQHLAATMGPPA